MTSPVYVEVTGTFLTPQGTPAGARIEFWPSNFSASGGVVYCPTGFSASADANGNWSVSLLSTDSAAFVWYADIELSYLSGPERPGIPKQQYIFELPASLGPTVEFGSLPFLSQPSPTSPAGAPVFWEDSVSTAVTAETSRAEAAESALTLVNNVRSFGATGNGTTDDTAAIQAAINSQQTYGGIVWFPPGTYLVNGATTGAGLVCAPGSAGSWSNSTRPLVIRGSGSDNTTVLSGNQWQFGGLFTGGSSGVNPTVALLDMADITLDGNCSLNGGTLAQPVSGAGALVNLPWPFTSAASTARNGQYHTFTRVRFYRPTGYGFQPTEGVKCIGCTTLNGGQPGASLHYDNFGSGQADAILLGHTWKDSAGNYADFVATTGFIRLIMVGCESYNHGQGGVYGCGNGSIITGNNLDSTAGGIGYDVGTASGLKSHNIVVGNVCPHLAVKASLDFFAYGDLVHSNVSSDQTGSGNTDIAGTLTVQNAITLGTVTHTPSGSPGVVSDGSNMYFFGTGSGGSRIYFRPSGYGAGSTQLSVDTSGLVYSSGGVVTNSAALATTATSGFLYIPTCAGPPTGTPAAQTGTAPMVYDSTNNNLYVYNGTWKKTTTFA